MLAEEALALAAVRKVIAKFITDDLTDQSRAAEGAGDNGGKSGAADGLSVFAVGGSSAVRSSVRSLGPRDPGQLH